MAGLPEVSSFIPFSPDTRRTESLLERGGHTIRAVKGALRKVAEATGFNPDQVSALEAEASERAQEGCRVIAVARQDDAGPLRFTGLAFLRDAPRPDARKLIDELQSLGVSVKILKGDALPVARETAFC